MERLKVSETHRNPPAANVDVRVAAVTDVTDWLAGSREMVVPGYSLPAPDMLFFEH
jgi:hypothetical protein